MDGKTGFSRLTQGLQRRVKPLGQLHQFSDSALHIGLMLALLVIVLMALVHAFSQGVAVWQLDPVVVHGVSSR